MKLVFSSLCINVLFPVIALGGVMNGGGGKGVLCRPPGEKPSLRVLDTYEAARRWPERAYRHDLISEMQLGFHQLDLVWAEPDRAVTQEPSSEIAEKLLRRDFFDKVIYIPEGARIPVTQDATLPVLAPNCEQVQIALYTDLGIELDRDFWEMLSPRDQAALALHEVLYFYRRTYGAVNSDETRAFVGRLFSTNPPTARFADAPAGDYLDCTGGKPGQPIYDFAVYQGHAGRTTISFRQIDNATTLGRTYVSVPSDWLMSSIRNSMTQFSLNYGLESEFHYEDRSFNMKRTTTNGPLEISLRSAKNEDYAHATISCFVRRKTVTP